MAGPPDDDDGDTPEIRACVFPHGATRLPSSISHAIAGLAVGAALRPIGDVPRRYWVAAVLCAVLPDLDAIGRPFGALDLELILGGHRGLTHSIAFAIAFGAVVAWGVFRDGSWDGLRTRLWLCFSLATMTHGFLDALTTNGDGVKFLSPFSEERFTFLWHPIDPSGAARGRHALARIPFIIGNELLWVALPCAMVVGGIVLLRHRRGRRSGS